MTIQNEIIDEISAGLLTPQRVAELFRHFEFRIKLLLTKIDRLEKIVESYEREECRW